PDLVFTKNSDLASPGYLVHLFLSRYMRQHSKLQLHVLNLYKKFLRASARHSPSVKEDIQESFRKLSKDISKSDTFLIEYHVRRAERQLRQLETSNISGVSKIRI